jgi:Helicase
VTLGLDLARAIDPATLCDAIGMRPDPWQTRVLRSDAPRTLLNCSRQSGKSTIAALASIHTALYEAGSLTLLLSPSQRQSAELFKKVVGAYKSLGRPVPSEAENQLSLTLENGSRVVSLPGQETTVRGFSGVRLLVIDEAARVPDELYGSVRPMLAVSDGRLIALSTPYGTRGWFFEAWRGSDPWARVEVPADQCPRISAAFLDEERRTLGEWWYSQEYGCRFAESDTQAFSRDDVEAAVSTEVEVWVV